MKVLIVEDNEVNRRLVREVFRHKGHQLEEAETAAEAIAALGRGSLPDAVLLDIDIPGGGLSVLSHIRATPLLAGLTVIALTALAMVGDRERFLAAGCDGYIAKPIGVKTFVAEIEAILRERLARG
jgi:two-component system cell cycle response regulator DivK